MITETFISILTIVGLIFLIFTLAYIYLEKKFDEKEHEVYKKSAKIIEHANERSASIIEKATEKAKETLLNSEYLKQDLQKDMQINLQLVLDKNIKELNQGSEQFRQSYEGLIEAVKEEYIKATQEILKKITAQEEKELEDFRRIILQETVDAQSFISKKINEEYEKVRKDIEGYRNGQIKKVDESIDKIIAKVANEALQQSITLEQHEKLVIDSLEKAKKEGLFSQ